MSSVFFISSKLTVLFVHYAVFHLVDQMFVRSTLNLRVTCHHSDRVGNNTKSSHGGTSLKKSRSVRRTKSNINMDDVNQAFQEYGSSSSSSTSKTTKNGYSEETTSVSKSSSKKSSMLTVPDTHY